MKVGIVTLAHNNDNYGGTLQAIALCSVLQQYGHTPFLANSASPRRPLQLSRLLEHPIRECARARRFNQFVPFWQRHFLFDPCGHRNTLSNFLDQHSHADAYICGSDQIWSSQMIKDPISRRWAFLDFGPSSMRRIAYAPSFGTPSLSESFLEYINPLVSHFHALSTREESGTAILRRLGMNASWVVDPVFLPGLTFWEAIADEYQKPVNGKTLFYSAYRWPTILDAPKTLRKLARQEHLDLKVPCYEKPLDFIGFNMLADPAAWLSYIRSSSFIVTNSFHTMAFCIIFRRPFAVLALGGKHAAAFDRMQSIAKRLKLSSRLVETEEDLLQAYYTPIDWDVVYQQLTPWIQDSKRFLERSLS